MQETTVLLVRMVIAYMTEQGLTEIPLTRAQVDATAEAGMMLVVDMGEGADRGGLKLLPKDEAEAYIKARRDDLVSRANEKTETP